jgi:hypothetical protein
VSAQETALEVVTKFIEKAPRTENFPNQENIDFFLDLVKQIEKSDYVLVTYPEMSHWRKGFISGGAKSWLDHYPKDASNIDIYEGYSVQSAQSFANAFFFPVLKNLEGRAIVNAQLEQLKSLSVKEMKKHLENHYPALVPIFTDPKVIDSQYWFFSTMSEASDYHIEYLQPLPPEELADLIKRVTMHWSSFQPNKDKPSFFFRKYDELSEGEHSAYLAKYGVLMIYSFFSKIDFNISEEVNKAYLKGIDKKSIAEQETAFQHLQELCPPDKIRSQSTITVAEWQAMKKNDIAIENKSEPESVAKSMPAVTELALAPPVPSQPETPAVSETESANNLYYVLGAVCIISLIAGGAVYFRRKRE